MKKSGPYVLGVLAIAALVLLVLPAPFKKTRKLDERITLRQRDKIPYGTFVARQLLSATFSKAHITFDKAAPGYWSDINPDSSNQAVFLICKSFNPDPEELKQLTRFIKKGNYVFVITKVISYDATRFLGLTNEEPFLYNTAEDSLQVALNVPFARAASYIYPGKNFDSYFPYTDSLTMLPLGTDANGHTNFIQLQSGRGKLFIHLAPLAFSNYFILHKTNIHYFQKAVSLLPQTVNTVVWNEYYLSHRNQKEKEPNVLSVLWQHESFRWALITAVSTLLLYVLSAMRRSQRLIPFYAKPANDSLDFVRTMGRLYYDRRDHHNLSKKMAAFFFDHVRSRYKIVNVTPDETFAAELHAKTGYDHGELKKIVDFAQYINTYTFITEQELARFYQQLKDFYQKTGDGTIV